MGSRRIEHIGPPWPELMTIKQGAAYLNVSRATLAYWVYRVRHIPHVSLGPAGGTRRVCRIKKADLDRIIEQGTQKAFRLVRGAKS